MARRRRYGSTEIELKWWWRYWRAKRDATRAMRHELTRRADMQEWRTMPLPRIPD